MRTYLSFETAVADIDARLDELRGVAEKGDLPALAEEIARLEARGDNMERRRSTAREVRLIAGF